MAQLDGMSEAELKISLAMLVEQLKSRATQEAIRLHEALRHQEDFLEEKRKR